MPYIVHGETAKGEKWDIYEKRNFDYEYPEGLDLKPGSDFHNKLASKIWTRANESHTEMSKRFDSWRELDRLMTVYVTLDDKEKIIQEKDKRRPVSIVFPYTYSMLEALLTYMAQAFFQDPMFQYEAVEDDDVKGAMMLELVVRLHTIKHKVQLALHTVLRDALLYGVGIGIPGWRRTYGKVPIRSTSIVETDEGGQSTGEFVNYVDQMIFEGNELSNVDPYMWLPDPTVSSVNTQQGEFIGWIERNNYMNLLADEQSDENLFNMKYVKLKLDKRSTLARDQSERQTRHGGESDAEHGRTTGIHPTDTINMYIKIIPKDWGLGDSEYPEKWFFQLTADDVVTQCYKAEHNHGLFPVGVASPEFDGYSTTPIGRMEILYGLQNTLDFLFNTHIANVRKSINDMLVVDPYLVNIADLKDPKPGKLIRLRRPAWGHGVKDVVSQLTVQDITRANIADSSYITQWMDRISGADQSMQGSLRQGGPERLTRSEFQGTRGSAVSRLQRLAMIIGVQFMQDIGTMFAVHTQQYMEKDTFVRISGRHLDQLHEIFGPNQRSAKVTPWDIAVQYDTIVRDGSIPGGNFSESWVQLFTTIAGTPELHQQFDIFRIFMYIAQQMGAKNVEDFRRVADQTQVATMPDEQVQNEADKGNLVPLGGGL